MTPMTELRRDLERLPAAAMVPVGWILERLHLLTKPERQSATMEIDLTVEEVAALLHKKPPTVRAYCGARLLPGAYRLNGKQWRIPRTAIEAFQHRQQKEYDGRQSV